MDTREMFLVMGYGETPLPEIELVSTLDEAFNAVARMVCGDPSPSELLEARADFCDFEERVRDGFEWHATFEIGGIRAWKVCGPDDLIRALTAPADDTAAAAQLDPYGFGVTLGERMYIDSSQHYRNGTVHLTIKRKPREAEDVAIAAATEIGDKA
ncbi:MAG: hypothetical protein P4L92_07370 [Rudaea sp.]|nr:hypothetical protein [Rudaea sp.]